MTDPKPLPTVDKNPERCETCRFWLPADDNPASQTGLCVRFPPSVYVGHLRRDVRDPVGVVETCSTGNWLRPWMHVEEWCGEWQAKRAVPRADAKVIFHCFLKSLPPRTCNTLVYAGVKSLEQLTAMSLQDLLEVRNCGEVTAGQIKVALAMYGLSLRAD